MSARPPFIGNVRDLPSKKFRYPGSAEEQGRTTPLAAPLGLPRIGVNHQLLMPGERSSWPHAEELEEEFAYILEGAPDVWIDGELHRLRAGDAVAFLPLTNIAHCVINNSDAPVRLLGIGENFAHSRITYPCNPIRQEQLKPEQWWNDAPQRPLGAHDGLSNLLRGEIFSQAAIDRPSFIRHVSDLTSEIGHYPNSNEAFSCGTPLSRPLGLSRVGVHHELVPPGRRTSLPHAEELEEEFVYVLEGAPDLWIDGELHRLAEGDAVAFAPGTGIAHTAINNTRQPVRLIVMGEQHPQNRCFFPLHPQRMEMMRPTLRWNEAPVRVRGSHDGLPDALRETR